MGLVASSEVIHYHETEKSLFWTRLVTRDFSLDDLEKLRGVSEPLHVRINERLQLLLDAKQAEVLENRRVPVQIAVDHGLTY